MGLDVLKNLLLEFHSQIDFILKRLSFLIEVSLKLIQLLSQVLLMLLVCVLLFLVPLNLV